MHRELMVGLSALFLLSATAPAAASECGADLDVELTPPSDLPAASGFGRQIHPLLNQERLHSGLDYVGPVGSPVRAAARGVVAAASYDGQYGNRIVIRHGPQIATTYSHLQRMGVAVGACVEAGTVVGFLGSTGLSAGPHLHFEVLVGGEFVDPVPRLARK